MKTTQSSKTLFGKNQAVPESNLRWLRQSALCLWLILLSPGLSFALPPVSITTRPIPRIGEISGTIQWPKSVSPDYSRMKLIVEQRLQAGGWPFYKQVSMTANDTLVGTNILSWGNTYERSFTIKRVPLGTIRISLETAYFSGAVVTLDFEHTQIRGVRLKYQLPPK